MTQEDIEDIKKELEEQKKRNEEMARLLRDLDKKLKDEKFLDEREHKVKKIEETEDELADRILDRDLREIKRRERVGHREPIMISRHIPRVEQRVEPKPAPLEPFPFDSEEFKIKIEQIKKNAEKLAKEGIKVTTKISDRFSKGIQKYLEKETERITKVGMISKEDLREINNEIAKVRREIDGYQQDIDRARDNLNHVKAEVRAAQRRLERSSARGDVKEIESAKEDMKISVEQLSDTEEHIRELRSELIQAKREFARLQRRAERIHNAHTDRSGSPVIRINDVDVDGTVSEYINRVMNSVGKSLETTFKTTLKDGKKIYIDTVNKGKELASKLNEETDAEKRTVHTNGINGHFYEGSSVLLSALGDENRLKILKILEKSPQYQKELAEETGLKGGSFKHHTDILQEADFITREAVRGRYLITQLGIEALKLAEMIYVRKKRLGEDSINIDIED